MPDRGRGQARQPKPHFKQQRNFGVKPVRGQPFPSARPPKHARTHHELDPRKLAFSVLSRLPQGDLLEPAVITELRQQHHDVGVAHRILPMLEDATRFANLFDALIAHVSSRPPEKLDRDVRAALHLFLAWYLLDDPKSVYAHGQAAVNLMREDSPSRGFVNACVRRLGEFVHAEEGLPPKGTLPVSTGTPEGQQIRKTVEPEAVQTKESESHSVDEGTVPKGGDSPLFWRERARLGRGRYVVAKLPIFPDPAKDLAGHLATVCALPRWFIDKLLDQHGPQGAIAVALASIEEPPTWVRANRLRTTAAELRARWQINDADTEVVGDALRVPRGQSVVALPGFDAGLFYVQDLTSQRIAPALGAKAGEAVLDLCAAPGGKASHVAELTGDRAKVLACDVGEDKIERIQQNIARMGYTNLATVIADARSVRFPEKFDRVLIDAPCSNSGVLGRRVEARHRLNDKALSELVRTQMAILENAARNVKPGGTIVYSVCSVLMEEGVDVVRWFLSAQVSDNEPGSDNTGMQREEAGWEMKQEQIVLPAPGYSDGMYWAVIVAP
ncbi:MAG: methyltransferase domain-containing protein [Planctomycetes bacterium]|nr:methyltransferase domain-containing protein [Planctomycetota bacterium]